MKWIDEFKQFAIKGNVIDMAVGIVIGASFGTIVKSFVDDILMPPLGVLLGKVDFSNMYVLIQAGDPVGPYDSLVAAKAAGATTLNYGMFVNSIISFLIVALSVFIVVKYINRLKRKEEAVPAPDTKQCQHCMSKIDIGATRCPHCTSDLK